MSCPRANCARKQGTSIPVSGGILAICMWNDDVAGYPNLGRLFERKGDWRLASLNKTTWIFDVLVFSFFILEEAIRFDL